jgi:hypothetical protein
VYFASWDYFISTYAPHLPHVGTCAGEPYAAVAGDVILSSYLVLFISFYIATYKKGKNIEAAKKAKIKEFLEIKDAQPIKQTTRRAKRRPKSANKTARQRVGSSKESFS